MAGKMIGISGADAVLHGNKYGFDFSTEANNLNDGFDQIKPFGGGVQGVAGNDGQPATPGISTTLNTDLVGPRRFNADCDNQDIMTDVNGAGMKAPTTDYTAFDAEKPNGGGAGPSYARDWTATRGNDRGLNLDDTKASGDY